MESRCRFQVLICFFTIALSSFVHGLIDLEENVHNFVLETKQIEIPEFPSAFNASIIRWNDALLMSFRVIPDPKQPFHSKIGLVWLNEEFEPAGPAQLLDTQWEDPFSVRLVPPRTEEARLILVNGDLHIVYSDNKDQVLTGVGFRLYIAKLVCDGELFTVVENRSISDYPHPNPKKREKNWVPFEFQGKLLLAYSISPHDIFEWLPGTGKCQSHSWSHGSIDWDWGELRGGTPALKVGDEYLGFFHSAKWMESVQSLQSHGKAVAHYFMGAYTFSSKPPFRVTKISPEPILAPGFYTGRHYKPYWGSIKAIFPCGFIFDDNFFWVTYGKQDREIWIAKIDKAGLYESLVEVP